MKKKLQILTVFALAAGGCLASAHDGHEIKIPLRSRYSPVQKLNRDGVEAVKKHQYEKAESLFYKAYLYDPADPFTLNNLGYVAEMQGQLDRAQKFYDLAAQQGSNADIDQSSERHLKGQPMRSAVIDLKDQTMRMNRMNIEAMRLLQQERGFDAVRMLQETLKLDPRNPFTLENLGVAYESIGDFEDAIKSYRAAADTHSSEPVVVTLDRSWRGRSVSATAEASVKRLQKRLQDSEPSEAQAIMFTLRGVYEVNGNNWQAAREDFLRAYQLDPQSAFTLNNRGFVAEHEGDLETAQFFYEKARRAPDAGARVGLATDLGAQGKQLVLVANDSNTKVDTALDRYREQQRRIKSPVELTPRGAGAVQETSPQNQPSTPTTPEENQQDNR